MTIEYVKAQIKKYIDESKTNGELFRKVMDLYMKDDSIPIETREKTGNLIEKYYYNKENIESIEPERKRGKWSYDMNGYYKCSECGISTPIPDSGSSFVDDCESYHFCRWCGADMREGEQE